MISDARLTVAMKNFRRNRMVNLTAISVKHFLPNAQIHCFTLYKESMDEYADQDPILPWIHHHTGQTQFVCGKTVYDHVDERQTNGYAHPENGVFFTEGYNIMHEHFKQQDEPLLMLAEDHFFQTGATLRELLENDWDVAYADGDSPDATKANGSILAIRPARVAHLFPMPCHFGLPAIEWVIGGHLLRHIPENRLHRLSTRKWINYCGDGIYTNSSEVMEQELRKAGIL
jgi:hypothetical protein